MTGFNYAIQVEGNGPIKLGFTASGVQARLASLQHACPYELSIIAEWRGFWEHERALHRKLDHHRMRAEWYRPDPEVFAAIEEEIAASEMRVPSEPSFMQRLIELAGGPSALSRQIGVTPQAISQWRRVPPERVLEVERITGISRHELRPDIYGPAPQPTQPQQGSASA
jgi:hypothetical protein